MRTKLIVAVLVAVVVTLLHAKNNVSAVIDKSVKRVPVVFSGGHETDPRDKGRPVVLIAAAVGVMPEVFRDAFSRVHPARPESGPSPEEARANKAALLSALAKFGITNDRLDEVSDYYRYRPGADHLWKHAPPVVNALVRDGVVVGYEIVNGGSGYSSVPKVSIPGMPSLEVQVELSFGKDLRSNGSIVAIKPKKSVF